MAKIKEMFDTQHDAQIRMTEILSEPRSYVTKIDLRSVGGKYKLIAVSYPIEDDKE